MDVWDNMNMIPMKYCTGIINKMLFPGIPSEYIVYDNSINCTCHFTTKKKEGFFLLKRLLDKEETGGYTSYYDEDGDLCSLCTDKLIEILGEIAENIYFKLVI